MLLTKLIGRRRRSRTGPNPFALLAALGGAGAAIAWLRDSGRRRRIAGAARGAAHEAATRLPGDTGAPKELDDATLSRKVESVLFREQEIPKGDIDVNAADGVVWLRGVAKTPEMIKDLERRASEIPEVRRVENLLRLPDTPAPTRTDTPPSMREDGGRPEGPGQPVTDVGVAAEQPAAGEDGPAGAPPGAESAPEGGTTHGDPLPAAEPLATGEATAAEPEQPKRRGRRKKAEAEES